MIDLNNTLRRACLIPFKLKPPHAGEKVHENCESVFSTTIMYNFHKISDNTANMKLGFATSLFSHELAVSQENDSENQYGVSRGNWKLCCAYIS